MCMRYSVLLGKYIQIYVERRKVRKQERETRRKHESQSCGREQ